MTISFDKLRTPDDRFVSLPDFPFQPNYISDLSSFEGLRMHYVDVGPKDADTVFLCLHGQPTWSYLYRKMIPVFARNGARVIAPDLFGFGKSDKPTAESFYTFTHHRNSLIEFIKKLNIQNVTLVCQDWGGVLGLTLPPWEPSRFKRLVVMNTALATGQRPMGPGFLGWLDWVKANPDFSPAAVVSRSCTTLSDGEKAAYDAPFPDIHYKAGARRFPGLVPQNLNDDGAEYARHAVQWWSTQWTGASFMAIGMQDQVITPVAMYGLRTVINGCPEPHEFPEAGHFIQEQSGHEVAELAMSYFNTIRFP
jgi:haloalkane dehalogenase